MPKGVYNRIAKNAVFSLKAQEDDKLRTDLEFYVKENENLKAEVRELKEEMLTFFRAAMKKGAM